MPKIWAIKQTHVTKIHQGTFVPKSTLGTRLAADLLQIARFWLCITFNLQHCTALLSGKYCHMFLCVHCLKENVACTQNGQCCKGQCVYGRCKKEGANGKPGTFCDRHEDCTDPAGTCCVR